MGGAYTHQPPGLATRFDSSSPLACRAVAPGSVLAASRATRRVHARGDQARTRWETVWSLSEFDQIGDGVFNIRLQIHEEPALLENGMYFMRSPPHITPPSTSRQAEPQKIFYR